MQESFTALVVHQNSETLASLKSALERQGMCIILAESRAQANRMLGGQNPAPLVFTETELPDGTWADILADAERAAQPVNVIVVARVVDTRFYLEAIETGAFDFLAPRLSPRISPTWSGALSTMSSRDAAPAFLLPSAAEKGLS